ncbi:methyl-accepting chemotaxis protein [Desulfonema magnum]|uniref:Methyl-accepting chemotaxis protein signailing-domain containing protein, HAMP domain-containing n=1 Tax=Desulfonema magnum TaxID=45655 RepID=A0A975GM96_9BACT|nr:methyl-accepting chemotaxis protein [Desulfonema magnum]QTA86681.1 Methyl-accepting chemotaxis protein signailing-domain containing protein, HAMP domain-containing [Desulfonema magnum]
MKYQTIVKRKMGTISLIVILASICVATSFSVYDYINESRRLKSYFDEMTVPISKRLASSLQRPLWFMDKKIIPKLIELEAMEKSLYAVVIRDAEKQTVLFARKRDKNWKIIECDGKISGDFIVKNEDIMYEGELLGVVDIYFTTRFIEELLKNLTIDILIKISVMSFCLVAILSVVLKFYLVKPVSEVIRGLKDIAEGEGDLTRRLEIKTKDEIGVLADCFNLFIEKLRIIISQIAQNTNKLSMSSEELALLSTQMAFSVKEMNAKAETVASASREVSANVDSMASTAEQSSVSVSNIASMTEEMSSAFTQVSGLARKTADNVKQVAESGEDMSLEINQFATSLEEMTASLNEIAKNTAQASRISQNANQRTREVHVKMSALVAASKQIGKIIRIIKDIADQTNMLALNATIEAAGAGDAGKGFGVVASEVKELARQSANATDEISDQIEHIQKRTDEAVKAMEDIGKIINEITAINEMIASSVEEQTVTANEISKSVSNNAVIVKNVAKNANESAILVGEIAKSTNETSEMAKNVAQNVDELARGTRNVAKSSSDAAGGVQDISRNIQDISMASKSTAEDTSKTDLSSKKLSQMAVELSEIVKKFKL